MTTPDTTTQKRTSVDVTCSCCRTPLYEVEKTSRGVFLIFRPKHHGEMHVTRIALTMLIEQANDYLDDVSTVV